MLSAIQWQSPQMLGVALLVGVLVVLAVGLLYPGQTRLLPGVWRWSLPGLRCLALLVLAVSVARPVAQRPVGEEEQGAVVVLVDNSRSMDVRDDQRRPAMLVALADGLGKLPAGKRTRAEAFTAIQPDIERLAGLVATINQALVELSVARDRGTENPAAQRRFDEAAADFARTTRALAGARAKLKKWPAMSNALAALERLPSPKGDDWSRDVDNTIATLTDRAAQFQTDADEALYNGNAEVKSICDRLARLTRFQLVEQALTGPEAGLLTRLPARAPLFGYAIGPRVTPLALRGPNGEVVKRLLVSPEGAPSDLTGGLREVTDLLRHQPVQSVVLFSDGRQVGAEASFASSLVGSGVPVFAVCPAPVGKGARVRDIAIANVSMPQSVFVGEQMTVTVDLHVSGVDGKLPEVTLQVGEEVQRQPIRNENGRHFAEFNLPVNDAGPQRVTIGVGTVAGEISADNNTAVRWVKVLSDRFDVLLVGGSPSWDFRYLRNALSRTQWINAQSVLLEEENARLGMPAAELLGQDVIILDDAPARALSPEQWEAVRRTVAQRGGSIILLAGQAHLPREYTGDFLSEFLPYRRSGTVRGAGVAGSGGAAGAVWRVWPGEEPEFRVVPAQGAPLTGALALEDSPQASADRWLTLPPVFRFLALPELKEAAQPLLVERGSSLPVLTRQRLGRGSVFFLGIDETWRWRGRVGEREQDRFFRQLVRAAADEPYAVTGETLALDADRVTVAPGEPVRVRARVMDAPGSPGSMEPSLDVDVVREDGTVARSQRLMPIGSSDSGRYDGTVGGLEAGDYRLRLRGPDGAELEYPLHVVPSFEAEMANLTPDEDLLKRLASSSGGQFRTLEQVKDLGRLLSSSRARAPKTAELRLWDSWYLYAFVLACLGAEWSLRKRFGLA
jgi:hypothetical protein